jgi:hypothetical protein
MPQMSFRIGLLFGLLVALAVILWFMPKDTWFFPRDGFTPLNTSTAAPVIEHPPIVYPARNIASASPSSPNQMVNPDEIRVASPEVANDPYSQNEESSAIPERLRHPERMFQPGPDNTTHGIAEASGIASESASQAGNALQTFTPEFAQNGGEFMQGIMANDTSEPGGFSAF